MHYGNIGSFFGGLAGLIAAIGAVIGAVMYGPAWIQDGRGRRQAQAAKANEEANLAREQAHQIELERRGHLHGWSEHGIDTFAAALVTTPKEMDQAREELTSGDPTSYVIMRVAEGRASGANRARRLRDIIASEGFISRPPTPGEREALEAGLREFGIPKAAHT
jgi:hypothetical protein